MRIVLSMGKAVDRTSTRRQPLTSNDRIWFLQALTPASDSNTMCVRLQLAERYELTPNPAALLLPVHATSNATQAREKLCGVSTRFSSHPSENHACVPQVRDTGSAGQGTRNDIGITGISS